ncbi:MAG: PQQ-binding-like beta-propeller repeat protein [Saprospiraceae bacterium]|nr:PQQ-binding-like beta-propeller repeat protein [Saprospiraceae bacterium]
MKVVTPILLLIAMIIAGSAHAQIAWQRSYGLPNIDEALQFVYPAEEPGYFWAAGITSSFGQDDWLVVKLDTNGLVVWADTIGDPNQNEYLWSFHREPATGEMWLAGSKTNFSNTITYGTFVKLAADGSQLFDGYTGTSVHETSGYVSVAGMPDGGAVLLLHQQPKGLGQLQRINANGSFVYVENLPNSGTVSNYSQLVAPLSDGRFYFFRNVGSPNDGTAEAQLSLRDTDGTPIWTRSVYVNNGEGITTMRNMAAHATDGFVYVLARQQGNSNTTYLMKYDPWGNQIWSAIPVSSQDARVKIMSDTTVAVIHPRGIDVRDAVTGNKVLQRDFSGNNLYWDHRLYDADFLHDGRGVFVGESLSKGSRDGYFGFFGTVSDQMALLVEAYVGTIGPDGEDDSPHVAGAGGHLFLASHFATGDTSGIDIQLRRIDPADGAEEWTRTLSAPKQDYVGTMTPASDGTLLLVSDTRRVTYDMPDTEEVVIRKLDPGDGTVMWETRVPNPEGHYLARAVATADGGAVVLYHGDAPDPAGDTLGLQYKALRVSATGNILWQSRIEPTWSSAMVTDQRSVEEVIALQDGHFLAVGMEDERTGLVVGIDGATGESWLLSQLEPEAVNHNRRATSVVETASGDLMIVAPNASGSAGLDSVLLYRLASDGSILLRQSLHLASWHGGTRLLKDGDGHLYLLLSYHHVSEGLPAGLILRRIDENFGTLAETVLYDERWPSASSALLTDGSVAVARTALLTNSRDLLVAKSDGLPTVATRKTEWQGGFEVSPNPVGAAGSLRVVLESRHVGALQLEMIGPEGRWISERTVEKTAIWQVFEVTDLPPDPWFWIRISDGESSATRLVVR